MDLIDEIRNKINHLSESSLVNGLNAAVRHLQVAEKWLIDARSKKDEEIYNDVIYRTNQAFEGVLKEAYRVLIGHNTSNLSTYEIEKKFSESSVLTPRVTELFRNYRTEWRNKSVHDHRLLFSDQEAFLAIVNVSAFILILINQLIEVRSSNIEQEIVAKQRSEILKDIGIDQQNSLMETMIGILFYFSRNILEYEENNTSNESETAGKLTGFIQGLDLNFEIKREVSIDPLGIYRPDFVISKNKEHLILELKKGELSDVSLGKSREELELFLEISHIVNGIIYSPVKTENDNYAATVLSSIKDNDDWREVIYFGPH